MILFLFVAEVCFETAVSFASFLSLSRWSTMVHYFDLLIHYTTGSLQSRNLYKTNTTMNRQISSTSTISSSVPINSDKKSKCKQLGMKFSKLFIILCGPNNKSSRRRFWYILLIFMISTYIMCIADVLTQYRWQSNQQKPIILPDIGFDFADEYTPSITKWVKYPDIIVTITIAFTFLWLLFDGPEKQRLAVFRRYLTIIAILYLGRAICVISTQLPTPFHSDDNQYNQKWSKYIFYEALMVFLRVKSTNNDVFYSGHTVVITISSLLIDTYCTKKYIVYIFWISNIFSLYVIIATKFHYTIDVIIAFMLSIIIWKFYHMTMRIKEMRNQLPIFKWFESDKECMIYSARSNTDLSLLNGYNNYNLNKINLSSRHQIHELISDDEDTATAGGRSKTSMNQNETTPKSLKSVSMDLP